jgi:hypothetical protein
LRRDTISHAYELMKIGDERTRRRLAKKVAAGELTLAKLRALNGTPTEEGEATPKRRAKTVAGKVAAVRAADDALLASKGRLAEAVEEMVDLLRQQDLLEEIPDVNRDNLAKYLTITKLKLENAIAIIRATRATE